MDVVDDYRARHARRLAEHLRDHPVVTEYVEDVRDAEERRQTLREEGGVRARPTPIGVPPNHMRGRSRKEWRTRDKDLPSDLIWIQDDQTLRNDLAEDWGFWDRPRGVRRDDSRDFMHIERLKQHSNPRARANARRMEERRTKRAVEREERAARAREGRKAKAAERKRKAEEAQRKRDIRSARNLGYTAEKYGSVDAALEAYREAKRLKRERQEQYRRNASTWR